MITKFKIYEKNDNNYLSILYENAQHSEEYQNMLNHGYEDVSSNIQKKNGTFIFEADYKNLYEIPIERGIKPHGRFIIYKKIYGVFKYETPEGLFFRIRTSMESESMTRKEIYETYEDAFRTIFRLHENYMKTKRKKEGNRFEEFIKKRDEFYDRIAKNQIRHIDSDPYSEEMWDD